jgi:hypothetical protein
MSSIKDTGGTNTNLPSSKTAKDTLKEGQSSDNSQPDQYSDGIFFVELDEEKMKEILQDVKPEDFKYKKEQGDKNTNIIKRLFIY